MHVKLRLCASYGAKIRPLLYISKFVHISIDRPMPSLKNLRGVFLVKKSAPQIFKRRSNNRNIRFNVQEEYDFGSITST